MKNWWSLAALVAALLLALAGKSWLAEPPSPRLDRPASAFDAVRAKERLAIVLGGQRPHPVDSGADDAVRERLLDEIRALGLAPVIRDQFACNSIIKGRGLVCARVRNILVPIGPSAGRAVLLNAHYDSSPAGPGASDDGIGVATLLEVAAHLRSERLARPVLLLFNEGEEAGLLGARAFLDDPLSASVDSIVNLEARGVRGPVAMFETDVPNARAIAVLRGAVAAPSAGSLSTDLYRLIPNSTDVTTFAPRRWLTLNLAPSWNETRYHSAGDELAALDPATLQHMGDQTLALARRLAAGPVPTVTGTRIFMDVAGQHLVVLPLPLGIAILALLLLLFAVAAWRREGMVRALLAILAALLGGTLAGWLGLTIVGAVRQGQFWRAHPGWTLDAVYAGAIAAGLCALAWLARRAPLETLRRAYWLSFLVVGALLLIVAPGGIVYFLLPPLFMAAGLVAGRRSAAGEQLFALLAAAVLAVTVGSVLAQLEELLNGGPLWLFAPVGALLLLPFLIEASPAWRRIDRRALSAAAAALVVAAWVPAALTPAYSADRQQQWTLEYVVGGAVGGPRWAIVNDRAPLPLAVRRLGDWRLAALPYSPRKRWTAPAAAAPGLLPPALVVVSEQRGAGGRVLTVRLLARGADAISLQAPRSAPLVAAGLPGRLLPIAPDQDRFTIRCSGRSCDGALLSLQLRGRAPLALDLVGARYALPPAAAPLVAARPPNARPQYVPDETLVLARARL